MVSDADKTNAEPMSASKCFGAIFSNHANMPPAIKAKAMAEKTDKILPSA